MKKNIPTSPHSRETEENRVTFTLKDWIGTGLFTSLSFINMKVKLWPEHAHSAKDFII